MRRITHILVNLLVVVLAPAGLAVAQTSIDTAKRTTRDTAYQAKPVVGNPNWHRPTAEFQGTSVSFSREAIRCYRSPLSLSELFGEAGTVYPLTLGEEGYGRESWLSTARTNEAPVSMQMESFVPISSLLNGEPIANYFPLVYFSNARLERGPAGLPAAGAEQAGSDDANLTIERFRAPVPYSRILYVQDLDRSVSNFDALFSINASKAVNTAFGIFRRASGTAQNAFDPTLNPRTDVWGARAQLGLESNDSTKKHPITGILWGQYTTAFSGLNGGIFRPDTGDVFDEPTASVFDVNSFDHRVRGDALFDLSLSLLSESPTTLGAYYSYEARRFVTRDTIFPAWPLPVGVGQRYGAMLAQPLNLSIGDFLTHAALRGDFAHIARDSLFPGVGALSDSRLAASLSDSLALRTQFRISLYGFVKLVQSNVKVGSGDFVSSVFPSVGASGTIGFTDAVSFTASYLYAKDRAELSPSPLEQYQLRNISGYLDLHVPLGHDSLAVHAGILDRHEPEGIVPKLETDSLNPQPRFSGTDVHSQSAELALDLFFGHFHLQTGVLYFPTVALIGFAPYTSNASLLEDLSQRFFGNVGMYYEEELGEGNLRLSAGARLRFVNRLEPELTYDRASDYFWYRGLSAYGDESLPSTWSPIPDARLSTPKGMLDLLLSAEVDQRAQIGLSFLNLLGAPFYTVAVYPYSGFHWRLNVTWAFLD